MGYIPVACSLHGQRCANHYIAVPPSCCSRCYKYFWLSCLSFEQALTAARFTHIRADKTPRSQSALLGSICSCRSRFSAVTSSTPASEAEQCHISTVDRVQQAHTSVLVQKEDGSVLFSLSQHKVILHDWIDYHSLNVFIAGVVALAGDARGRLNT